MPPAWMFSNAPVDDEGVDDVTHGMNSQGDEVDVEEAGDVVGSLRNNNNNMDGSVGGQHSSSIPTTGTGTEVVQRGSGMESVHSDMIPKDGFYISQPYKQEIISQQLNENSPGANRRLAVIGALRDLGVKVFIIEAKSIQTTADILHHVRRVVGFVARENRHVRYQEPSSSDDFMSEVTNYNTLGFQRCLLYQDKTGRLFNLTLAPHSFGSAAKFEDYLDSFSALQALIALTIMCRSFSCATAGAIDSLKPGILALILGLVMTEELSLSWLNASMLVRASPSVAAHSLTSMLGSDILRKAVLLCLALAGATSGNTQKGLTLLGISGACLLLLSNLGARAWHFMGWKPLMYQDRGSAFLAWLVSIGTGMALPFMAHRKIHVGGQAALEYVISTAVLVGVVFILSGIDDFQKFTLISTEACDQDYTNIVVGGWWFVAFVASLVTVSRMPYGQNTSIAAGESEPLLLKDHSSPVGFKVPHLPDYEMDPSLAWTGTITFLRPMMILGLGLVAAVAIGAGTVFLGFEGWDDEVVSGIEDAANGGFR